MSPFLKRVATWTCAASILISFLPHMLISVVCRMAAA